MKKLLLTAAFVVTFTALLTFSASAKKPSEIFPTSTVTSPSVKVAEDTVKVGWIEDFAPEKPEEEIVNSNKKSHIFEPIGYDEYVNGIPFGFGGDRNNVTGRSNRNCTLRPFDVNPRSTDKTEQKLPTIQEDGQVIFDTGKLRKPLSEEGHQYMILIDDYDEAFR